MAVAVAIFCLLKRKRLKYNFIPRQKPMLLQLIEKMVDNYFAIMPRSKPTTEQIEKARIIAHRGAHNNAQKIFENTDEAFRLAQEAGCWAIELDIHATADGVLVVNHDPTLTRLWGHDQRIAQLTFAELRALEPGVPSLEEIVQKYGRKMHLFIELKAPFRHEAALVQVLEDLTPVQDYHLLTLDAATYPTLSQFPKEALLLVAVHNNSKAFCRLSLEENYGGVMGSYLLLSNRHVNRLKQNNKLYGVGFVDSEYSLYRELNRNIPWIFSNRAVEVSEYLKTLKHK